MRESVMLIIIMALLTVFGVGRKSLYRSGVDLKHALFFLICVLVLDRFTLYPADEIRVSLPCVLIPAWTFGSCFSKQSRCVFPALVLPLSIIMGVAAAAFIDVDTEYGFWLAAFLFTLPSIIFGLSFGMAAASIAPVIMITAAFVIKSDLTGFAVLELTEKCLSSQLAGILLSCTLNIALMKYSTVVQIKQYVRTAT